MRRRKSQQPLVWRSKRVQPFREDDAQAEAARQQADADRQAAELAAAAPVEKLFEGIEKLADGRYKLTVESLKGGNPQIYYGASQEEASRNFGRRRATRRMHSVAPRSDCHRRRPQEHG